MMNEESQFVGWIVGVFSTLWGGNDIIRGKECGTAMRKAEVFLFGARAASFANVKSAGCC